MRAENFLQCVLKRSSIQKMTEKKSSLHPIVKLLQTSTAISHMRLKMHNRTLPPLSIK